MKIQFAGLAVILTVIAPISAQQPVQNPDSLQAERLAVASAAKADKLSALVIGIDTAFCSITMRASDGILLPFTLTAAAKITKGGDFCPIGLGDIKKGDYATLVFSGDTITGIHVNIKKKELEPRLLNGSMMSVLYSNSAQVNGSPASAERCSSPQPGNPPNCSSGVNGSVFKSQ